MSYNKSTPEEERIIVDRPNFLSLVSMTIFMKMERLPVEDAISPSFHPKASLMRGVDGQLLIKHSKCNKTYT